MKTIIKDKIRLRPSSISSYTNCNWQWFETHINDKKSIPSARAMMGTGVHKAAEVFWNESIKSGEKKPNVRAMCDAGVQEYDKEVKELQGNIQYDDDINDDIARCKIVSGTETFVTDIVPFTDIPKKVEVLLVQKINHPIISEVGGTIDYLTSNTIGDIKTSKQKIKPSNYTLQQSAYIYAAQQNGYKINNTIIQGVVFNKTKTFGGIDKIETNVPQFKYIVNTLLDKLNLVIKGADPKVVFSGNPKYYLCSDKYCSLRATCPFVKGL